MTTVDLIIETLHEQRRMTYREIERLTGLPHYQVSSKLAKMRKQGILEQGPEVVCPISGYTVRTWQLTPGMDTDNRPALDDPETSTEELRERLARIRRARTIIRRERAAGTGAHV